jgi:hypothetical protein
MSSPDHMMSKHHQGSKSPIQLLISTPSIIITLTETRPDTYLISPTNSPMYGEFLQIYSNLLQFHISPIQLFISTLMQIRSECAAQNCSAICQLMPSFKTLADPGKAYLPTPNPTLMQIRSECASQRGRMAQWLRPADCEVLTIKLHGINYQIAHLVSEKRPHSMSRWFQTHLRFYMAPASADIF